VAEPQPGPEGIRRGVAPDVAARSGRAIGRRVGAWGFRQLRRPLVWQFLIVLAADLAINAQLLLEFHGYLGFINFDVPYATAQVPGFPGAWSPYQYNGVPELNIVLSQLGYVTNPGPIGVLYTLFGPTNGAKFYIVGSIAFLGLAVLLLARTVVRSPWGQLLGALFLVIGPFQLQLYDQGDYPEFVLVGLVFLSIYLLYRALDRPRDAWIFFPLSVWVLFLGGSEVQFLILGLFLWLFFLLLFVLRSTVGRSWIRAIAAPLARVIAVPFILTPLLLTAYYGPLNLGPGSALAQSLTQFTNQTTDPLSVFFLQGYVGNFGGALIATVNPTLESVWMGLSFALMAGIWVGYFLTWDRRILAVFFLAVAASLFGAGPHGPLGAFNQYAYTHILGAQSLNTSYYWDWILVAPAYAVALAVLVERLLAAPRPVPSPLPGVAGVPVLRRAHRTMGRLTQWRGRRLYAVALVGILVASAAIPYGTGALYASDGGIHDTIFPADYTSIVSLIQRMVGNSYAAVAVLNPDVNWFLDNASQVSKNPFFLYPVARTPGVPVYIAPPVPSNYYFYWVYSEFYTNATPYVGELFALAGVEYLLVLNGTQSASFYPNFLPFSYHVNPNVLLRYQKGIVPIYSSQNFVLYQDLYYGGVASAVNSLTVVAGDYSGLVAMAESGVNLTETATVFPTDLTPATCAEEMPYFKHVYAQSPNALLGYALQCNYLSATDPLSQITLATQGWMSSQGYVGSPVTDRWPGPLAVALGGPWTLSLPVSTAGCGPQCSLWVPVRFNGDGGSLTFSWGSQSFTLDTAHAYEGYSSSMVWVGLPFSITGSPGPLRVTAESGDNAIGSVLVEGTAPSNASILEAWLAEHLRAATVLEATPAGDLAGTPAEHSLPVPLNSGILEMSPSGIEGASNVTVPLVPSLRPVVAQLRLELRGPAVLRLTFGSETQVVSTTASSAAGSGSGVSTLSVGLDASSRLPATQLGITLVAGSVDLLQVSLLPASLAPERSTETPDGAFGAASSPLPFADVNTSIIAQVVGGPSGYQVSLSAPAPLVFARVAFFTDLEATPSSVTIAPALGSVDAVLMDLGGHTTITVGLGVTPLADLGWGIAGIATAVWVVLEFVGARRRSRRTAAAGAST
jgi:hypothetical protein